MPVYDEMQNSWREKKIHEAKKQQFMMETKFHDRKRVDFRDVEIPSAKGGRRAMDFTVSGFITPNKQTNKRVDEVPGVLLFGSYHTQETC